MDRDYKTDTIALKKRMVEKGIPSIIKLSLLTGVNRNTMSSVLNGETQPSSNVMYRLVDVLEIPADQAGQIFFNGNLRIK